MGGILLTTIIRHLLFLQAPTYRLLALVFALLQGPPTPPIKNQTATLPALEVRTPCVVCHVPDLGSLARSIEH